MKTLKMDVLIQAMSSLFHSYQNKFSTTQKNETSLTKETDQPNDFSFKWKGSYEASLTK